MKGETDEMLDCDLPRGLLSALFHLCFPGSVLGVLLGYCVHATSSERSASFFYYGKEKKKSVTACCCYPSKVFLTSFLLSHKCMCLIF